MSKLTCLQSAEARVLRHCRPPVLIGTRVIVDDTLRRAWYGQVSDAMNRLNVKDVNAFCDLAGVPD
jgi:hypothetical protein